MAEGLHIVFMNQEATGHMNPTLPVVAELTERGCKVTYFVGEAARSVVEAAGAAWRPFRYAQGSGTGLPHTIDEPGVAELVPDGAPKGSYSTLPNCMVYAAREVLPALLEDLRALEPPPVAIVYDIFVAAAQVAAHCLGVPAIGFLPHPGPGVIGAMSEALLPLERMPWVEIPRRQIQERYGFDVLKQGLLLEFYSPRLNIVTTIEDFFSPPQTEVQKQRVGSFPFKCIGAVVNPKVKRLSNINLEKGRANAAAQPLVAPGSMRRSPSFTSGELPTGRIDAAIAGGRRIVLVSLGTVATGPEVWAVQLGSYVEGNDDDRPEGVQPLAERTGKDFCQAVWRICFEALGEDPSLLVVMAVGPQADALEGLPPAPSNFVLREAVPQIEVLQRCHAMLSHGGANSTHEALSFGVPLAVVPLFGDQPCNADAVARVGAGVSFRHPLRTLTAESLRTSMHDMLDADGANAYRLAAAVVAKKLEAAGGVQGACDAILGEARRGRDAQGGA